MALRTTRLVRSMPTRELEIDRPQTIEELRELHEVGSFDRMVLELAELNRQDAVAKELTNAKNRQITAAEKAMKAYFLANDLTPEDEVMVGPLGYRYDVAYSERVDPKELYALIASKKITVEQFLQSITVNKEEANKAVGAHILSKLEKSTAGKTIGIRTRKLDNVIETPVVVRRKVIENENGLLLATDKPPPGFGKTTKTLKLKRRIQA